MRHHRSAAYGTAVDALASRLGRRAAFLAPKLTVRRLVAWCSAALLGASTAIAASVLPAAAVGNAISYHGGSVQHHPKVFLIFLGPSWTSDPTHENDEAALRTMFNDLGGTSYDNIMTQYTDSSTSHRVYNDPELAGVVLDSTVPFAVGGVDMYYIAHVAWAEVHGSPSPACLPNAGCSTWLDGFARWALDTQFVVIPQQGTTYSALPSNLGGLSTVCGEHDDTATTTIGYQLPAGFNFSVVKFGSDNPCTSDLSSLSNPTLAALTDTASHEYAETVTDPEGDGWYNSTDGNFNGEIADECNMGTPAQQVPELGNVYVYPLRDDSTNNCVFSLGLDSTQLGCGLPMHTVDPDFDAVYTSTKSVLGCPWSEKYSVGSGSGQDFAQGHMYSDGASPPHIHEIHGAINGDYQSLGGPTSFLGFPMTNEQNAPGGGRENLFNGASCGSGSVILWTSGTGAHEMQGCIYHDYLTRFGGPASAFGYPTSNETGTRGGGGRVNYMSGTACGTTSHGSGLFWSSVTGTWPVHGCIFQKYEAIGEDGSGLGLPTSDEFPVSGGIRQNYRNGSIQYVGGVITVTINGGPNCTNYGGSTMTGPNACVGFYTTNTWFSGGGVGLFGQEIWTYANGTVPVSTANYSLRGLDVTHVYQLQAYIPNNHSNASKAHYHYCSPGGGCADGYVNQNNYTNQWANFGAVCSSDGTATIVLADDGGDTYPVEVGADAIRAVRTGFVC